MNYRMMTLEELEQVYKQLLKTIKFAPANKEQMAELEESLGEIADEISRR